MLLNGGEVGQWDFDGEKTEMVVDKKMFFLS